MSYILSNPLGASTLELYLSCQVVCMLQQVSLLTGHLSL
jgi:hypothetical protein